MLGEWRNRLGLLIADLKHEADICRTAANGSGLIDSTRNRLITLADANESQVAHLLNLLAPLGPLDPGPARETLLALRTRLPREQGLTNYYVNLHRDYVWGDEENAASAAIVESVIDPSLAGLRVLVLGAGSGRLARDLHVSHRPALTVALDFNPLLLFAAREVLAGREVRLHEFPIAPRSIADSAPLRTLRLPDAVDERFVLIAADALRVPFADASFDVVLTPWFIDIVPQSLPELAARINRLLAPAGRWINFGSLSFSQEQRALRFSAEEALAVVRNCGFADPRVREASLPYMRSPASRHSRVEEVIAWQASKISDVAKRPEHVTLPAWLVDGIDPVPLLESFRVQAATTRIHAALIGLIDGKRSVHDMAETLVQNRLMHAGDAEPAVRGFLARLYEEGARRTTF